MLGAMRYDLSAFLVDWTDPQLNTATPNWGFFAVANGESAESTGAELQLSGTAGDHLTYGFGWAYVDAKLTADFISPVGTLFYEDGKPLPGAPLNSLNASLDWRTGVFGDKEFIAHLDGYYQSETRNAIGTDKPVQRADRELPNLGDRVYARGGSMEHIALGQEHLQRGRRDRDLHRELHGHGAGDRLLRQRREGPDLAAANHRPVLQLLLLTAAGKEGTFSFAKGNVPFSIVSVPFTFLPPR